MNTATIPNSPCPIHCARNPMNAAILASSAGAMCRNLMPLILDLGEYKAAKADPAFKAEFDDLMAHFVGRPSPLYFAPRMTRQGAQIWFKREELNHTGAHKINNCIGQILLAIRMGKTKIIAETGAGQHGVATATVCALWPALHDLHGRDGRCPPTTQRFPHETAGRRSGARHQRRGHAQGCDERGAARLGRACA
jgi:tryptophan synthase beta chain